MGPMGGIHAALKEAKNDWIFVVPCDMPLWETFLVEEILKYRLDNDIVVPQIREHMEPLFALYKKTCIDGIEQCLNNNIVKVLELYPLVKTNYLDLDVDDVYAKYASELPEVMMGNVKYDGKYYGVPMTMNIVGMFANMEILQEAGYDAVPATYDELIACCDALVAKGVIPFGCAGKETWCVTEYLESIIEKTAGATALNQIFAGDATWGNEDVAKGVGIFQEMIEKQYFDPEGIALSNDEIKANFMAGKYAFYMNGTWNCADFDKAGLSEKVQVAEFPVIDSSKSQLGELIGGPSDTLAVAADSPNAAVAAESAFEIAKGICHYGYLDGCGLPAWTPDYDTSSINPLTQSVAEIVANSSQMVLFGDTAMSADSANIYLDYVGQIYASAIDGQAFVDGLVRDIQ